MKHNIYLKDIPNKQGLYFLFNKNKELIYIGISIKLKKRIHDHFIGKDRKIDFEFFRYSLGNYTEQQEGDFIRKLKPPLNRTYYHYWKGPWCKEAIDLFVKTRKTPLKFMGGVTLYNDNWCVESMIYEYKDVIRVFGRTFLTNFYTEKHNRIENIYESSFYGEEHYDYLMKRNMEKIKIWR